MMRILLPVRRSLASWNSPPMVSAMKPSATSVNGPSEPTVPRPMMPLTEWLSNNPATM